MFLMNQPKKQLRPLPTNIRKYPWIRICRRRNNCNYGLQCTFAHSEEETKVWRWMMESGGMDDGDLSCFYFLVFVN